MLDKADKKSYKTSWKTFFDIFYFIFFTWLYLSGLCPCSLPIKIKIKIKKKVIKSTPQLYFCESFQKHWYLHKLCWKNLFCRKKKKKKEETKNKKQRRLMMKNICIFFCFVSLSKSVALINRTSSTPNTHIVVTHSTFAFLSYISFVKCTV